ncbi:MAG: hypothetical protein QXE51_05535 [Nitrososphaeria archaeon]
MPAQLILQQGKKPPFPYVLADVSEKNKILQVPSDNYYHNVVTGPTFGTAIPQQYTIIIIYFNDDNWGFYDTIIVPANLYPPGIYPFAYPSNYVFFDDLAEGPTNMNNNPEDPIPNYEPMPSSVLTQTNAYINVIYPYWIPNQKYNILNMVYSGLIWSGPPNPQPPPAHFAIARVIVVIT